LLLKDSVRYLPYEYVDEKELEQMVLEHYKEIFGINTLYFDPQTMKTETGTATRSDGIIIPTDNTKWYILEVELASHRVYDLIVPQIMKFNRAYRQPETRKKIANAIFTLIKKDPYKTAVFQTQKIEDTYKYLNEIIDTPPMIGIVIDQKTPELEAVCKDLKFETRTTEFKTYTRENAGTNVHVHEFEPLYETQPPPRTLQCILMVLELVYKRGKTYDEAAEISAKRLKLLKGDIKHRCTIDLGLKASQLRKLLNNKEKLTKSIIAKFPDYEDTIREAIS